MHEGPDGHWIGAFGLRLATSLCALWPPLAVLAVLDGLAHRGSVLGLAAFLAALLWAVSRLSASLQAAPARKAWTPWRRVSLGSGVLLSALAGLALLTGSPPAI